MSLAWSLMHVTVPVVGSTSIRNLEESIIGVRATTTSSVLRPTPSLSDGTEVTLTQEETQYFMPAIPDHPKYLVETAVTFWRFPVIQPCTIAVP